MDPALANEFLGVSKVRVPLGDHLIIFVDNEGELWWPCSNLFSYGLLPKHHKGRIFQYHELARTCVSQFQKSCAWTVSDSLLQGLWKADPPLTYLYTPEQEDHVNIACHLTSGPPGLWTQDLKYVQSLMQYGDMIHGAQKNKHRPPKEIQFNFTTRTILTNFMYSSHTCQVTGQKALNFCTSIDKFLDTLDLLASTSTKEDPCRAIGSGWTVIDSVFFPNDPAGALDFKRNVYSNFLIDSDDIRHLQPADYDSFLLESVLLRELVEPHHVNIKRENSFSVYIGTHLWKYFTLAMSSKRCQISSVCIDLFFFVAIQGGKNCRFVTTRLRPYLQNVHTCPLPVSGSFRHLPLRKTKNEQPACSRPFFRLRAGSANAASRHCQPLGVRRHLEVRLTLFALCSF